MAMTAFLIQADCCALLAAACIKLEQQADIEEIMRTIAVQVRTRIERGEASEELRDVEEVQHPARRHIIDRAGVVRL